MSDGKTRLEVSTGGDRGSFITSIKFFEKCECCGGERPSYYVAFELKDFQSRKEVAEMLICCGNDLLKASNQ